MGSTDVRAPDPDDAACDEDEEAYLCAAVAEVFPGIPVTEDQVVARFCGVRPLPRADGDVGAVTRDHSIATLTLPGTAVPVLCLIGGKWTTFRAFAEQAADHVLTHLGRPRRASTVGLAIGGGKGFPRDAAGLGAMAGDLARAGGVAPTRAEELLAPLRHARAPTARRWEAGARRRSRRSPATPARRSFTLPGPSAWGTSRMSSDAARWPRYGS